MPTGTYTSLATGFSHAIAYGASCPFQVCRSLLILVDNSPIASYKLELGLAGMINGPLGAGSASISSRLVTLRAYQAVCKAGQLPLVRHVIFGSNPDEFPDGFLSSMHEWPLKLWRPPSRFFGTSERNILIDRNNVYTKNFGVARDVKGCTIDVTQDLIAVSSEIHGVGCARQSQSPQKMIDY